jgi:DNA helicase-2/ATP-dependent DNA helicase PcrA
MIGFEPSVEQQAVLDLGLDTIRIRAGAGTGKTTTVALVIANLVEAHGVDPERILGITFTNKAASELADRVKTFLGPAIEEGRQAEVHTYHGFAAQILSEFGRWSGSTADCGSSPPPSPGNSCPRPTTTPRTPTST